MGFWRCLFCRHDWIMVEERKAVLVRLSGVESHGRILVEKCFKCGKTRTRVFGWS